MKIVQPGFARRSTPKVKNGKVQRKNRWVQSPNYYLKNRKAILIERRKPGRGYRHIVTREDIEKFIELIPNWAELSRGLNAIVLVPGSTPRYGYHVPGVLHICAWEEDLWQDWPRKFAQDNVSLLERLRVPTQELSDGQVRCFFSEENAKAFQLLDVFLHELGHHRDRMTTKHGERTARGEEFAERFALEYEAMIFPRYVKVFRPRFARLPS